jgi:polyhydroxyalkanoate synthesis regulator phasin
MSKKKEHHDGVKELVEKVQHSFKTAEEAFQKTVKELSERLTDAQGEAKKRLDEVLALVQGKDFAELQEDALARVVALREEVEGRLDREAFWSAIGLATKSDLDAANKKIAALSRRVKELEGTKSSRRAEA